MDFYWVRMPAPTRPPGRSPLARSMLRRESPRCQEFAQDLPTQNVRWWTAERQEFLRKRRMRRGKSESTLLTLRWTRLPKLDSGSGRDATVLDGPFRRGSHGALVGIILLGRDHSFRSRQPRGTGWDTSLAVRGLSRGEPLLPRAVRGADYARGPRPVGVVRPSLSRPPRWRGPPGSAGAACVLCPLWETVSVLDTCLSELWSGTWRGFGRVSRTGNHRAQRLPASAAGRPR